MKRAAAGGQVRGTGAGSDVQGSFEIADDDAQEGVALAGIPFEAFEDDAFEGGRDVRIDVAGDAEVGTVELPPEDLVGGFSREGFLEGEEFVGHDAEGEDIHPMIVGKALQLLGGHVGRGSGVAGGFAGLVGTGLGEVEIDEFDIGVAGDQEVLGFEVEVHVPGVVDMFEGTGAVDENIAEVFLEQVITAGEDEFEVGGLDVLHREVGAALDAPVMEVTDDEVVALELAEDLAAAAEPAPFGEVEHRGVDQAPDGQGTTIRIAGQPDLGEAPAIDEFLQSVRSERSRFQIQSVSGHSANLRHFRGRSNTRRRGEPLVFCGHRRE